ncbi:cyclin-like protein [Hesseltinella vesiculosa]|uniref:Cyclin-like protein n=1 Tax=Hesseltinella vesiculosa TaxID=101127 RepID=A0A1X2G8L1_9FUNG|nr:cyclin-like protein [Hesseltinella vesiculosa]
MISDQWRFSKEELFDTPSIADGLSYEQEQMDRTKGCVYLMSVATRLNLSQLTIATATTYFHRFYMRQSMKRFHIYDMAATCLYVATKVEESTRRMKDFINVCAQKASKNDKVSLEENSKDFIRWKDTMLINEVVLLEVLCFDLAVEHPQNYLAKWLPKFNRKVPNSFGRKIWSLLYQCYGSPLCALQSPDSVAAAVILLASYLYGEHLPQYWWDQVDLDGPTVNDLATDLLQYTFS